MSRLFWRSAAICGLAVLSAFVYLPPICAQQTLGSINGTVLDPSGAAVPGATVTVTADAIGVTFTIPRVIILSFCVSPFSSVADRFIVVVASSADVGAMRVRSNAELPLPADAMLSR